MKPTHLLQFIINDYPEFFAAIEYTEGSAYINTLFIQANSWEAGESHKITPEHTHVCGSGYYKWDSCNHLRLTGEENNDDSYYHLCGANYYNYFFDFLKTVQYAASQIIQGYDETVELPKLDEGCQIKITSFDESQDKEILESAIECYVEKEEAKKGANK